MEPNVKEYGMSIACILMHFVEWVKILILRDIENIGLTENPANYN